MGSALPILVTIADITVLPGMIITPSGQLPLRGAIWTVSDNSHQQKRIPGWVIALSVLFIPFTCGLSLLLLGISETDVSGHIEVTVSSGGRFHQTSVPATWRGTVYQGGSNWACHAIRVCAASRPRLGTARVKVQIHSVIIRAALPS
ncbi:hypothetical protein [Nocardia sp. NBC_00511]|uniref:hypothetical protein n=1 Tax=Nocardia sp. NBC_00511 TaxID=2903591 RepID=UPI0030E45F4A